MARLLYVDSDKFKKLRKDGGWEAPHLFAIDAGVSTEAVRRAESHGRNYLSTIKKFARTLGLASHQELLADDNTQNGLIIIELHFDTSKEDLRKLCTSASVIRELEKCVKPRNAIRKVVIRYGSVRLQMLCHYDDAPAFVAALATNRLDFLRASSIRFVKADIQWVGRFAQEQNQLVFFDASGALARLVPVEGGMNGEYYVIRCPFTEPFVANIRGGSWFYRILWIAMNKREFLSFVISEDSLEFSLRAKKPVETLHLPPP